jgi:hypothetical protein
MMHRTRRRAAAALLATLAASALLSLLPGTVVACSCIMPGPMAENAGDPTKVVVSGTILPSGRPGVDVAVDRWFQGPGGAVLALAPDGFSDLGGGADCRVPYPAAGSSWIFVAYVANPGEQPQVNLCTPQGDLATPEGQAMLADAVAAFGEGISPLPSSPPATDPVGAAGATLAGLAPVVGAVAVAAIVFGGLALVLRRRDGES